MSVYPKQTTVQGSIFNPSLWIYDDVLGITTDFLNANYVKYPVAQSNCDFNGIENAGEQVINGILETYGDVSFKKTTLGSLTSLATQPLPNDNTTKIPTTAWVQTAIASGGVAETLEQILQSGNSAGIYDIDMNENDVFDIDNVKTKAVNFRDISTGTATTTRIYQDNLVLTLDNTQLNSSIIFQTRTSGNVNVTPLSIGNTVNKLLDRATLGILGDSTSKDADQITVLKKCLTGRGYNVLR